MVHVVIRHQAITWSHIDPNLWDLKTWLGHNVFMCFLAIKINPEDGRYGFFLVDGLIQPYLDHHDRKVVKALI